jgi:restriction endonuclease
MKIHFDSKQQYQLDAVSAVVDIFDGQPLAALDFTTFMITESLPLFQGQTRTELGMGNQLILSPEKIRENVRKVQEHNDIIEFVQAANPIFIIDEPQSVDNTDKAQEAIKALNPLCTLRYSATHRNPYNLVYRLDPIRAFDLKLVKQIIVGSSLASGHMNDAFVRVESIDSKTGIKAKLRIHVQTKDGPKEKLVTIKKNGADLYELSDNRACYRDGFVVTEINAEPGNELIRFNNGTVLPLGQEIGGMREDVWRVQIANTIKKHLDKELEEQLVGKDESAEIWTALANNGFIARDGKIQPTFEPRKTGFALNLPPKHKGIEKSVIDVLSSYQIERHIKRDHDEGPNRPDG